MAVWEQAGNARRHLADMAEDLSAEQLSQPTLCEAWDARGVLGHVTSFVETGGVSFFATMIKSGFNFDKASQVMAQKQIDRPVADVIASLRAKATKSAPLPMFPEEMTLSDVIIHTQDIRRPLGLDGSIDEATLTNVLGFLTEHKLATTLVDRRPIENLKLTATDLDWTWGTGDEISGSAEALIMALANRSVLDELEGDGVASWS